MIMNKFHLNKHKRDTWKCDRLVCHIRSIIRHETSWTMNWLRGKLAISWTMEEHYFKKFYVTKDVIFDECILFYQFSKETKRVGTRAKDTHTLNLLPTLEEEPRPKSEEISV